MLNKTLLLMFFLFAAISAVAQTVAAPTKTAEEEKQEKAAVDFLRETLSDVNNLRTLENRISFSSELAGLMWFHDEAEAKAMFSRAVNDFQQLVAQYDAQMNSMGTAGDDDDQAGPANFFLADESERRKIERKFRVAMAVRQQIAMSLAEHEPDMAFSFYYASLNAITNPEFRKQTEASGKYFEFQLMNQIASRSPEKAGKFAVASLANGLNYQHVEILKKIYAKDPEKAADLASAILSKVKSDKLKTEDFWVLNSLMTFGTETLDGSKKEGGKKPIYSESELKDLADTFAKAILDLPEDAMDSGSAYVSQIERFAPGRAVQIKAKLHIRNEASPYAGNRSYRGANTVDTTAIGEDDIPANVSRASAKTKAKADRENNQKQMMDDVMKVGSKDLPKEQRDSIIAQARKILLATPGKDKKIAGLSLLAAQVAKAGDKNLAAQIMKDAESLVNPQPKNYQDYLLMWMLATGYASADPDKAFPILDETIGRANETIAAFIKVAEFVDVNNEIIQDGELQVGAFGGSMINGLTRELGMADSTLKTLAKADFEKTKGLTYRFERPEVRILAKMMVLRAVMGDGSAAAQTGSEPAVLY